MQKLPTPLLQVDALVAGYDPGVAIVNGVTMTADRGEIVAVLGPNGAGKSTLIKAIAGLAPPSAGRVLLDGCDITAEPAHAMVRLGVSFVPQTDNVFATLSVSDNLMLAAHALPRAARARRIVAVCEIFPDLDAKLSRTAGGLSGGQRQMLAVARALMVFPKLLLLDEPSAGLSPKVVGELFRTLAIVRRAGVGVVLVEQNVRAALAVADRAYVLVSGCNRHAGPPGELRSDPAIAALFLGGAAP